jgi:hypothetical protein
MRRASSQGPAREGVSAGLGGLLACDRRGVAVDLDGDAARLALGGLGDPDLEARQGGAQDEVLVGLHEVHGRDPPADHARIAAVAVRRLEEVRQWGASGPASGAQT